MQSLYGACQKITEDGISEIQKVGGYDIYFERFTQNNLEDSYSLGNTDQSNIVLLTDSVVQVSSGKTLTVASPKKSLVIMCDTLINDGIISMTGKGSNALPHDYLLLGEDDGYNDIIIPAYANNAVSYTIYRDNGNGIKGNNGVNRQCGSGGGGSNMGVYGGYGSYQYSYPCTGSSGSGSAFAGGGGGSGHVGTNYHQNSTYPMQGANIGSLSGQGGVGNPPGSSTGGSGYGTYEPQNTGVGGRLIIFCNKLINNGTISANGVNCSTGYHTGGDSRAHVNMGGASGGGAIDIFYGKIIEEGTITAKGGQGAYGPTLGDYGSAGATRPAKRSGDGGDGSITLTPMNLPSMIKPGYLGVNGLTRLITLIRDETASAKGDYLETNTIKLTKDGNDITADAKISEEANNIIEIKEDGLYVKDIEISQEQDNGLYRLDDGLYVRFASFTDDEIFNIVRLMQSNSIDTNVTTADFYAILTKEGYIVRLKEDSDG